MSLPDPPLGIAPLRRTILLVDDEADLRGTVRRALRAPGFEFLEAEDASEALALIAAHHVDAIICDYRMPGMDGFELLRQLQRSHPGIVRVMLSGEADRVLAGYAVTEGVAHHYLRKPWDAVDLRARLTAALEAGAR
jgi:CheY-like chemotaxis protein